MIRRPPRSTLSSSSAASDVYKRQLYKAPPSGEITMTSFTVFKKTSLSQKRCVIEKKLLWNINRKSGSPFQNMSFNFTKGATWCTKSALCHFRSTKITYNSRTVRDRATVIIKHEYKVVVGLLESVIKIHKRRHLADEFGFTSFLSTKNCLYLGNGVRWSKSYYTT